MKYVARVLAFATLFSPFMLANGCSPTPTADGEGWVQQESDPLPPDPIPLTPGQCLDLKFQYKAAVRAFDVEVEALDHIRRAYASCAQFTEVPGQIECMATLAEKEAAAVARKKIAEEAMHSIGAKYFGRCISKCALPLAVGWEVICTETPLGAPEVEPPVPSCLFLTELVATERGSVDARLTALNAAYRRLEAAENQIDGINAPGGPCATGLYTKESCDMRLQQWRLERESAVLAVAEAEKWVKFSQASLAKSEASLAACLLNPPPDPGPLLNW